MKFDRDAVFSLCGKIALSEPEASAADIAKQLSYFSEDTDKIVQTACKKLSAKTEAVDYSVLREDLPISFSDPDKLFENSAEKENNCLSIPKII